MSLLITLKAKNIEYSSKYFIDKNLYGSLRKMNVNK